MQREHDSLDRSQNYAMEIEKHGDEIIGGLFGQS
jgi:hypothetical protein